MQKCDAARRSFSPFLSPPASFFLASWAIVAILSSRYRSLKGREFNQGDKWVNSSRDWFSPLFLSFNVVSKVPNGVLWVRRRRFLGVGRPKAWKHGDSQAYESLRGQCPSSKAHQLGCDGDDGSDALGGWRHLSPKTGERARASQQTHECT